MPHAELTLPGHASSVPAARRFVETLLGSWGHPEVGWSAALCTSELAANCALHARTDFSVRLTLEDDGVRLEVSDGSSRVPQQRRYDTAATTGRGLRLLDEYASDWGVEPGDAGKTVWVVIELAEDLPGRRGSLEDVSAEALMAAFGDEGDDAQVQSWWNGRVAA